MHGEWLEDAESQPQLLREDVYVKLLLLGRNLNGNLKGLFSRQRHVYLQRLRDLADQEKAARAEGRMELALLFLGGRQQTEAELKWLDACVEQLGGTDMDAIVELTNVSRVFNGGSRNLALDRVSLKVAPGEFTAVMGEGISTPFTMGSRSGNVPE